MVSHLAPNQALGSARRPGAPLAMRSSGSMQSIAGSSPCRPTPVVGGGRAARLLGLRARSQADDQKELMRLLEENNRLRKVMAEKASALEPEKRRKFAEQYREIAETERRLGFEVDTTLLEEEVLVGQKSSNASVPKPSFPGFSRPAPSAQALSASSSVTTVVVEPASSGRGASGSGARGTGLPGNGNPMGEEIDSKAYLEDIINLSVDLDPYDDSDDENAPPEPKKKASSNPYYEVGKAPSASASAAAMVDQTRSASDVKSVQAAARKALNNTTPEQAVHDKHHWMIVTVPERPAAGEELIIYFNRNTSETLRSRPRIQMMYGFNKWELKPEDGVDRLDLLPAGITRDFGADFWSCRIKVPASTFELNFVLTDGEGRFENNSGQDFTYAVEGGITWDEWVDSASERAAAAAAAKAASEKAAAEEAERQRQAQLLQQEKDQGAKKAEEMRNSYENLCANPTIKPAIVKVVPAEPLAGGKAKLYYNRLAGPLARLTVPADQAITLRYGVNGWQVPTVVNMTRDETARVQGEEWWVADMQIPYEAAAVNFVVNYFEHYDNNDRQDYKLKVGLPAGKTFDQWIASLSDIYFNSLHKARLAAEEAERQKKAARLAKRRQAQGLVKAVERRKVRHVLFTEPEIVTAGKEVTVYYNPRDTILAGRQRIWLQGGWNRWNHPRKFGPIEMVPPAEGEHFKATVKVPADAFKMDFVFSDVESGDGTYDSRGGFDYHLPVEGSAVREPSLYVVHVAVEMAPVAKVGGLGDVVTALGRAVQDQGHLVEVILPKYQFFNSSPVLAGQMKYETEFDWGGTRIFVTTATVEDVRVWLIEPRNGFFDTQTVYGRYDDEVRFDFFCKAALEFLLRTGRQPDILHCHDWSTAYVAKTYWEDYHPYGLWKPRVVFTIHNLNYGKKKLSEAAYFCQKFTTVSPTYAFETGGNAVIASQVHKLLGIRNGIDMDLWDPENNQWLPMPFNSTNVVEGKAAARKALRERIGLGGWGDKFIVGVVSRLTPQKGVHLIKHSAFRTVERGGQFVLLGSAPDPKVQAEFNALAQSYNGDVARFCFKYDEPLSHLIYAACDMIVVPSMFEPCGLTQMIAMRYGAVPIVRHTGGLKDTVFDVDFDKARAAWDIYGSSDWQRDGLDATNGFAFEGTDEGALDYALNRAIDAWYNDRAWFHGLQKRVMEQDWSWNRPALDYIELYHSAKKS